MGCAPHRYGERPPAETDHFRYIVLDLPSGDSLVITLWDPVDLDAFLADAMPIVESFQFDLATEPTPS